MTTRMLIDGRHPEETRVAVVKGSRIEEFDFEAAARKQIKGNIYLAKVTRVEPSLQAAFIDYGGNRHGFLAFSEIHPDYYQIPREDREALLREEQRLAEESSHAADEHGGDPLAEEVAADEHGEGDNGDQPAGPEEHGNTEEAGAEALRRRRMALRRRYKIQEVIRRRQVMLVQVVKEERGNKGAALTTYISLAGRYSVLMPNTAQGGGISRKIANAADRKRLKAIMSELDLPPTMGAIVRTAGLERTKTEIRRDFDYLTRLWDGIRETTLQSTAPSLIYEDSDLVKRAIRDIYNREIDEVLVDGEDSYRQAKDFMKLLMPSHARRVQLYNDPVPLFHRAGVESQLSALMNPVVNLKSGGYLVINPTEALVAVDVNSGRSTREHNIEETALKTNIEAAEEVARQLRLRDMAGLVVVDFIDMESHGNNRRVERALKEALRADRARIQVGRISSFGLLEMSRQRLRTGVLEASTQVCHMCEGTGLVRTDGSAALAALRLLEEEAVRGRASIFRLRADRSVAIYMLNRKRVELTELEARYDISIEVLPDDTLIGGRVQIDSSGPPPAQAPRPQLPALPRAAAADEPDIDEADAADEDGGDEQARDAEGGRNERRKRRSRRRRRGGRDRTSEEAYADSADPGAPLATAESAEPVVEDTEDAADDTGRAMGVEGPETAATAGEPRRRSRRRRRNGRRDEVAAETADDAAPSLEDVADIAEPAEPAESADPAGGLAEDAAEAVAADGADAAPMAASEEVRSADEGAGDTPRPRRTRRKKADADKTEANSAVAAEASAEPAPTTATMAAEKPAKPTRRRKSAAAAAADATGVPEVAGAGEPASPKPRRTRKAKVTETPEEQPVAADSAAGGATSADVPPAEEPAADTSTESAGVGDATTAAEPAEPVRKGWWNRTFGNR